MFFSGAAGGVRVAERFKRNLDGFRPHHRALPAVAKAVAGSLRRLPCQPKPWRRLKNDDFCSGNFTIYIKALCGIYDNFYIPGRNGASSKINQLASKMFTFVYFCIPSLFARTGFVLNHRVDRHGSVTKVVKTAPKVVKTVVKMVLRGGPETPVAARRMTG
jgi:hypothetical protein